MAQNNSWRRLRETAGLSLRETARRAGINPGKLSVIETGLTEAEEARLRAVLFAVFAEQEQGGYPHEPAAT
jgi:transcriptional regulator with XRE-family HTH domain